MIARIIKYDLHAVRDMQSLNEAQQLIRKLTNPIGEIAALVKENIQLAERHKSKVLENADDITPNRIPEKTAEIVSLRYLRTICTSERCPKHCRAMNKITGKNYLSSAIPPLNAQSFYFR